MNPHPSLNLPSQSLPNAPMHFQRFYLITPPQVHCNFINIFSSIFFGSLKQLIRWVRIAYKTSLIKTPLPSWFNSLPFQLDASVIYIFFLPSKIDTFSLWEFDHNTQIFFKSRVVSFAQQFRDTSSQIWICILIKKDKIFSNLLSALIQHNTYLSVLQKCQLHLAWHDQIKMKYLQKTKEKNRWDIVG